MPRHIPQRSHLACGRGMEKEMNEQKKSSAGKRIGCFIIALLLSPLLIACSVLILLYTPFDYLRYRLSPYYREVRLKYVWLVTTSMTYRVYRVKSYYDIPIEYKTKSGTTSAYGYFTYRDTLLLHYLDTGAAYFSEEDGKWHAFCDGRDMVLEDILKSELSAYERDHGSRPERAIAMMNRSSFENEELCRMATDSGLFILYGKRTLDECLLSFVKDVDDRLDAPMCADGEGAEG